MTKRAWLAVAGILVGIALIFLLGGRGEESVLLPAVEDQSSFATPLPEAQNSLAVVVTYQHQPAFQLGITNVARTFEVPTIDTQAPVGEESFSFLKLVDSQGQLIREDRFSVPEEFIFETFPLEKQTVSPVHTVTQGELHLVIPVSGMPARVVVATAEGEVLAEQAFSYDELPVDRSAANLTFQPRLSRYLFSQMWAPSGGSLDGTYGLREEEMVPPVVPGEGEEESAVFPWSSGGTLPPLFGAAHVFTIAVTDQQFPAGGVAVLAAVEELGDTVQPFKAYKEAGLLRVVSVPGGDVGCTLSSVAGNRQLPACLTGEVWRHVFSSGVAAQAVVVSTNLGDCTACGSSRVGSGVVAVGDGTTAELVGHELGHALRGAALQDEYLDLLKISGEAKEPNCLPTAQACEEVAGQFTDSSCRLGCNSSSAWRLGAGLMRQLVPDFGPFQTCLMSQAIAQEIGQQEVGFCPD